MTKIDRQPHVLVVEDELTLLEGLTDLLTLKGFQVTGAHNGQVALNRLENLAELPDLIISDIRMPIMDGYDFLREVRTRSEWVGIPFIFLTAKGEQEDIHQGLVLGAEDYVTKPFDFEALVSRIKVRIARKEQMVAAQESRMDQLRKRILNVINHELRTPLSYIVAYADLMATSQTAEESAEIQQYLKGIMTGTDRLSRLVERFLVLAEMESGTAYNTFHKRVTVINDVGLVIAEAVANVARMAEQAQVTLETHIDGDLPTVLGDPMFLEIGLRQLLDNAIKFSKDSEDNTIVFSIDHDDTFLSLSVKDNGRGLTPDEIDNIFDMFYQVNREEFEQQGIGAGLAIVKHVMNMHDGQVNVQSVPGQGSTFTLTLPVYIEEKATPD